MEDCSECIRNDFRLQLTGAEHGKSNVKRTNGSEFVIKEERETTNHYHQPPQEESQQRNTQIRLEARQRTFPISRVITRRRFRHKGVVQVAQALDFLYLAAKSEKQNSVQDAFNDQSHAIASRAMCSLQSRIPLDSQSPKEPPALLHAYSDWQIVTELFPFLLQAQPVPSNRGDFKPLDSTRIDLPPQNSSFLHRDERGSWIPTLSSEASFLLSRKGMAEFTKPLLEPFGISIVVGELVQTSNAKERHLPASRVYSLPGHYERVLHSADTAGMLEWSLVQRESAPFSKLADQITMTSFAVNKDSERDRIISWTRVQNLFLPEPPLVNLPSPVVFSRLRVSKKGPLGGFYLDADNMFHNICPYSHLVRFFPLAKARFGNLPRPLQSKLKSSWGFRPHQSEFVRPYQSTLPMGFKWAVYIAHTLAESYIEEAMSTFTRIAPSLPLFQFGSITVASRNSNINRLNTGDGCFFHIIDDVNLVANDWPVKSIVMLHRLIVAQLRGRHLAIKESKSLALGESEQDVLPFTGWEWNLKTGIIEAQKGRLAKAIADACHFIRKEDNLEKDLERSVGRLIWQALGHRLLFATLSSAFMLSHPKPHCISNTRNWSSTLVKSARKELAICATVSPLVRINVYRAYWKSSSRPGIR